MKQQIHTQASSFARPYREIPFVRDLLKDKGKTEEEMREAEDNLRRYIVLVKQMMERMEREGRETVTRE